MGENPAAEMKKCAQCGADVTSAPRVKDSKGNYYCAACAEKKKAAMAKKVAEGGGAAKPAGGGAAAAGGVPELDIMSRLIDDSIAKSAVSCPACRKPWKEGAIICINCGYNRQTNQMVGTQVKEPPAIKDRSTPKGKGKGSGQK